ncbi:MAG: hypothetical protein AB8B57_14515 [Congregibacter sp.]
MSDSMTSDPDYIGDAHSGDSLELSHGSARAARAQLYWPLLLMLALVAGCGTKEVVVVGNFPPPLMQQLPVSLGVWYEPEFSGHEFFDEAKGRADSSWIVKTGEAQVQMWDQLLDGMFTRVQPMDGKPAPEQMNPAVDAVLIPRVDELQYAIPAHTNVKVDEIWMRYAFELVTTNGDVIAEWTMTAYGKTPTAFLQSDEAAVNLAAVVALRDAGAHFITSFHNVPEVAQWLEDLQQDQPTAAAL